MRGPTRVTIGWTLLAMLLVSLAVVVGPPAGAHHRSGPCDVHRREGEPLRSHSTRLIRCAAAEWEVPGGPERAICIAEAESHLNPRAVSEDGEYVGLFQHSAAAWPERFDEWTEPAWERDPRATSGRSNAIVTIRIVNANGWGSWSGVGDC
jgi:hypothetical protein